MTHTPINIEEDRRLSGRETCERLEQMEESLSVGDDRMVKIEERQIADKKDIDKKFAELDESLKTILDIVTAFKGFAKVWGWFTKGFLWAGSIAAVWYMFKGK